MILRRVDAMSCAKISGALYGVMGILAGLIFAAVGLLGALAGDGEGGERIFGALFGVGAIFLVPVLYGIMGFAGGLLVAAVYNWLANAIGGLEIELQ